MKLYWLLFASMLAIALPPAAARGQEPGPGAEWERVEPEKPQAEGPAAAQGEAIQLDALCTQLGEAVARIAVMRDQGISRDAAMQRLETVPGSQAAKDFAAGNIAFVYAHPALKPAEIAKRIEGRCARMSH